MKILCTGGAGFIGSHFVKHMINQGHEVIVLDRLTYAGRRENLASVNCHFVHGDICNQELVDTLVPGCNLIVNFAAESHVDRSIQDPLSFVKTDTLGVAVLLEAARKHGAGFVQISTEEVYGSVISPSDELTRFNPSSPYSASKAGGELLVSAYGKTYNLPVLIIRGSNNYGPFQYPEKLVPLFITNALENRLLPLYGDGLQIRDWIFVDDFIKGIEAVILYGEFSSVYNIGAGNERTNLYMARTILDIMKKPKALQEHVTDRKGHDRRYSVDSSKIRALGWEPRVSLEEGLEHTVKWYRENPEFWRSLKDASKDFFLRNYGKA